MTSLADLRASSVNASAADAASGGESARSTIAARVSRRRRGGDNALLLLLEHGAIASAGGGYTDALLACLEPDDALRFRVVSKRCSVLAQRYRPREAVLLRRALSLLLKCFPRVERIACDPSTRVKESEWIAAAAAGKLKHVVAVRMRDPDHYCDSDEAVLTDRWVEALCSPLLLPNLTEIAVPADATRVCVGALCHAPNLRVIDFGECGCELLDDDVSALLRRHAASLQTLVLGGLGESGDGFSGAAFDAFRSSASCHCCTRSPSSTAEATSTMRR
jgi:hypothetical protein